MNVGGSISAHDLREFVLKNFPNYMCITRKEYNHEARLVDRKTGATMVSAGSNKLLWEKLEDQDVVKRLSRPPPNLGLVVESIAVVRKTEVEKLENMVNNAVMEVREWMEGEHDIRLVEDSAGKYRFMINGKFVVKGREMNHV